jgi:hypothetical protein
MNGIPQIITSKIKLQFLEWKLSILNAMSKQKETKKPVENTEEKKPVTSNEETKKLESELNRIELDIIKNVFDGAKMISLKKQKEEVLTKLGRDHSSPWKK